MFKFSDKTDTIKQPELLGVKTKELKNFVLFEIAGEINMFTSPYLRKKLMEHYCSNKGIIVDLSEVFFMDSSGVATLVEGLSWSKRYDKEFILVGLGFSIYQALSLTKLESLFKIKFYPGIPELVKHYQDNF